MRLAQGPQRSDAGEARTHGPSVLSQALYHWATALPKKNKKKLSHDQLNWARNFQQLIKTKIPTNKEVSRFKYLRCCIYPADKLLAF